MMAGLRGAHAGIDADEQHAQAGRDAVLEPQVLPGAQIRDNPWCHALAVQGRTVELQLRRPGARRQDVVDWREKPVAQKTCAP